jgi:Fur family transcriptional regulator, ferric uptake regulator
MLFLWHKDKNTFIYCDNVALNNCKFVAIIFFYYFCFMIRRRNTATQEAVLSVLTSKRRAMSQDAILKQMPLGADRATVYRILNRFCEDQIVHKIMADDGKQYFAVCIKCDEKTIPDNHFHFRCTKCETIECIPSMVEFSMPDGYTVERLNCVLVGVCKDCSI